VSFNSFKYILLFLPLVVLLVAMARKLPLPRAPQICILLASLYFYAFGKPAHIAYLLGSIVANWLIARWMAPVPEGPARKRIFVFGIALNIGFLCTFKYVNFFFSSIPYFAHHHIAIPDLQFPLGISFFTLAQIMYLIECYEEMIPPSSLFDHATFVSFFPYVISGPIARADRILHQFPALNDRKLPSADLIARALYLFSMGMIKKIVLADAFSKAADYGFNSARHMSAFEGWFFAASYALQLYFDFSGYSDMAIASALLLGIEIPRNFDAPFQSLSIIEFWQRWHITLSQFITTYLYTPIISSFRKATLAKASLATLIAMTIAGLWHGPNWTFVIFGLLHGLGLVTNQYWKKKKLPVLPDIVCWLITMALVAFANVFFRSPNLTFALGYVRQMFGIHNLFGVENIQAMNGAGLMVGIYILAQIVGAIVAVAGKSSETLARNFKPSALSAFATVSFTLIALLFLNSSISKPFVYFAF
jgi:D-alanyl-lipoteichoic acid acyltransferase DltB (MBOAT superfamily)